MPNPNERYDERRQGLCESDEAYAKRMAELDEHDAVFKKLIGQRKSELPKTRFAA